MNCHSSNMHLGDAMFCLTAMSRIPGPHVLNCNPEYHTALRELVAGLPIRIEGLDTIRPNCPMKPSDLTDTENEILALWNDGQINSLMHLEGSVDGSYEQFLCDFFHEHVKPGDWALASHRCHFVYQLHQTQWLMSELSESPVAKLNDTQAHGVVKRTLIEQVLKGRSMFLYGPRFLCSAIVAGTASIAAGLALSIQRRGGTERVWSFGGDGSEDHGHFAEAVRLVHGRKLPCHFIITDNNSSCGVTKEMRGSPDDWIWPDYVTRIRYTPLWPHAGSDKRPILKSQIPL